MWLVTEFGFFSVVRKPEDVERGTLTIRSRVRQDLENLRRRYIPTMSEIQEDSRADYRYRAIASKESVADAMAAVVRSIDYANVKDRVAEVQGDERATIYHGVWSALARLQRRERPVVDPIIPRIYGSIGRNRSDVFDGVDRPLPHDPSEGSA